MNNYKYTFFRDSKSISNIIKYELLFDKWHLIYNNINSISLYAIDNDIFNQIEFNKCKLKFINEVQYILSIPIKNNSYFNIAIFNNINDLSKHINDLISRDRYYSNYLHECNKVIKIVKRDYKIDKLLYE